MRAVRSDGMTLRGLEIKMVEYRVRPVTRWVITRYESSNSGASLETVCEINALGVAEEVGRALAASESGVFHSYGPNDLEDIPLLLRRIAGQVEDGSHKVATGVLTLRADGQRRPVVFGFGKSCEPFTELDLAAQEVRRLSEDAPGSGIKRKPTADAKQLK
jgi:hypothetical protein